MNKWVFNSNDYTVFQMYNPLIEHTVTFPTKREAKLYVQKMNKPPKSVIKAQEQYNYDEEVLMQLFQVIILFTKIKENGNKKSNSSNIG
jgi:hypothetical protein